MHRSDARCLASHTSIYRVTDISRSVYFIGYLFKYTYIYVHTNKSFRNLVKSTGFRLYLLIFLLIKNQFRLEFRLDPIDVNSDWVRFRLDPNHWENDKYKLIPMHFFSRIRQIFSVCIHMDQCVRTVFRGNGKTNFCCVNSRGRSYFEFRLTATDK